MAIEITMPRLSDTMEEGTLIKWRVRVGDAVKAGDVLADVETDKATMELQAFDDGTVAKLAVAEGASTPVGAVILVLAEEGEKAADAAKSVSGAGGAGGQADKPAQKEKNQTKPQAGAQPESKTQPAAAPVPAPVASGQAVRISPLARKLAAEYDVDVTTLKGSGPAGRIIKRDILAVASAPAAAGGQPRLSGAAEGADAAPAAAPVSATAKLEEKTVALSNMRKTIARRLVESKTTIPHFTVTVSVNMDPLLDLRQTLNAQLEDQGIKLTVNDFIVRSVAMAILQHPVVNSSWTDQGIAQHASINVGVAVALPEEKGGGLVVPVIRDTQRKGLRTINAETRKLADKARTAGLSVEEMSDGTFTISNMGMYHVDHFEAIINPPQAAILAVGSALAKPVVRDGQIAIGREMTLTLSADHRVIDGATGAQFLQTLRQILENPAMLLV